MSNVHESALYGDTVTVADAAVSERVAFIRRTYGHLAGAIVAFVALEAFLLTSSFARPLVETMYQAWIPCLLGFMVVGWIADRWAHSGRSSGMQYLGLGLYVVAQGIIFAPLLYYVTEVIGEPSIIGQAGVITLTVFAGLTGFVFVSKKDFSFMRGALCIASVLAFGLVICSLLFGFNLGTVFSAAMVALASGYVLYYTSNVLHHYDSSQHVAAALALFSAIALLFWYIIRLVIAFSGDD